MQHLPWLDDCRGQSTEELLALEGKYRLDSIVLAFEQALSQKAARVGEERLTAEEHVVLAVEVVEREVNNGGYALLFANASCDSVREMVEALRRIGCPITAEITRHAWASVQASRTTTDEVENQGGGVNNDLHAVLGECDSRHFARPERIEESLFAFIRANRRTIEA